MMEEEILKTLTKNGINYSFVHGDDYQKIDIPYREKDYTVNDCMLIRTTDVFPYDKVIETPEHGNAYTTMSSEIFKNAINELFLSDVREKYADEENYLLKEEAIEKIVNETDIICETCRSTLHFTINGLVGSHAYGNFEGNPYIILEPLKYHVDEKSLIGLRPEDTYFNDDLNLSNEAVIMMPLDQVVKLLSDDKKVATLKNFNVCIFDGDERKAVECVLEQLGYDSFLVNSHGYEDGIMENTNDNDMYKFIYNLAEEKKISTERHYYSSVRKEDLEKLISMQEQYNKDYFMYVLNNCDISEPLKENLLTLYNDDLITKNYDFVQDHVESLLKEVGYDKFVQVTYDFNKMCINNLKNRKNTLVDNKSVEIATQEIAPKK